MRPTDAREAREELASVLRGRLQPTVAVFAAPPETLTAPGLIVAPRSPYRGPSSYCQYELRLKVVGVVQRASGPDGMDLLDELMDLVLDVITGIDWLTWETVTDIGTVQEVGSVEYLTASIDILAYI